MLKYAVIGAGAIGCYYGGRLAQSGQEVHFLFHSEYEWVRKHGLKVDSVKGDFSLSSINAYSSTLGMPPCDVVLVSLKSTQNHLLPQMLAPIVHEHTMVVLVQNGLGLEQDLAEQFPDLCIAGGMAFICASRISPGYIRHADYGSLTVGFHQKANQDMLVQVQQDFANANVKLYIAEDLNLARWKKLVWNIPYNGLTVALETTTDQLMQNEYSRQLVQELMEETLAGAQACGAAIEPEFVEKMMKSTDEMTPYAPSMRLDWDHHRPMEIQAIYANPIRIARNAGYYMRKTDMLRQILLFKEMEYGKNR